MNSLSWFLYFADVVGNLRPAFGVCSVFTGLATVILSIILIATSDGYNDAINFTTKKVIKIVAPSFVAVLLVATLIPSRGTVYMIAGSEAGEFVVTSTEGKEIIGGIKEVIKHQLEELKGKKENNE